MSSQWESVEKQEDREQRRKSQEREARWKKECEQLPEDDNWFEIRGNRPATMPTFGENWQPK